ncbi:MAG: LysR substrate-binding domain-containing protein [Bacteroidia bacterium]
MTKTILSIFDIDEINGMNLQQLEYIIALDTYKNFTRAAEACFITQATLSTMVKRLEEELGVVLFDRKSSPLVTTDCGQEIIKEARVILSRIDALKQLALDVKGHISGRLRLGIIPTISGNLVHRIIPSISANYPDLDIELYELTTEYILEKLINGKLDAGVVSTPLDRAGIEEDILYYEKLKVYGKLKNTNKKYLMPSEIINEKVWLLEEGNCLRDQFIQLCSLNPSQLNSNIHFHPNSFESLMNMVDHNGGLTIIPELYCTDLSAERKRNVKEFKAPFPVREISLVYHRPYAKMRLLNMLAAEIKNLIMPVLETTQIKNNEMLIAKI